MKRGLTSDPIENKTVPSWRTPRHTLIEKRCENFKCRTKISKAGRFCSDDCWRSLLTIEELNRAIRMEVEKDSKGLDCLMELASERSRNWWLRSLPPVFKRKWNVN